MKQSNLPHNYQIISRLGKGAYGESFLVFDSKDGNNKVVKIFDNYNLWSKIKSNEDILYNVSCEYIVHTYAIKSFSGTNYIEQEYAHGFTLNSFTPQKDLPLVDFLNIANSFFKAMQYLSKMGLSHKDIKPSNIIYNEKMGVAKIVDLDYLSIISSSSNNYTGTIKYSAPEQIIKNETSIEADIYSFGLVMCFLVMGNIPFGIDHKKLLNVIEKELVSTIKRIENIDSIILDKIASLILSSLEFNPEQRINVEKAIDEIEFIRELAIKKNQINLSLHQHLNDITFISDEQPFMGNISASVAIISQNAIKIEPPDNLDWNDWNDWNKTDNNDTVSCVNNETNNKNGGSEYADNKQSLKPFIKSENKNIYQAQLKKEYDNILQQATISFWLWIFSFVVCFAIIIVAMVCILKGNYIEGLITVVLDGFVLVIQRLFNIREDHYRKLSEQKMKHLETGDYLDYAFEKAEKLEDKHNRNQEMIELLKTIREYAKQNN